MKISKLSTSTISIPQTCMLMLHDNSYIAGIICVAPLVGVTHCIFATVSSWSLQSETNI